jgi:hypothetical protein
MTLNIETLKEAARLLNEQTVPDHPIWIYVPGYGAVNVDEEIPDDPAISAYFETIMFAWGAQWSDEIMEAARRRSVKHE